MTYEFTLYYGESDEKGETKLYGQSANVVKQDDFVWTVDASYTLPSAETIEAPTGYQPSGWIYNDKLLTPTTVLKPKGETLVLETGLELMRPDITFIVDGEPVYVDGTDVSVNLSNDRKHTIGVKVSHVIEDVEDADVRVKFEYKWVDLVQTEDGFMEGPRSEEPGFGRYNMYDNQDVTNTITVFGEKHERTGDDCYRVVVYGYYIPNTGGAWTLFYQSANPAIGIADTGVTHNVTYDFKVVTSDPAVKPVVSIEDVTLDYDYSTEDSILSVSVKEQPGHTYSYQWYDSEDNPIPGADQKTYNPGTGLDVGTHNYSVIVTAKKMDNNDTKSVKTDVKLTVNALEVTVTPNPEQQKYTGQKDPAFTFELSHDIETTGQLSRISGETVGPYGFTIGTLESVNDNYSLKMVDGNVFEIVQYVASPIVTPEEPDGSNGWYVSDVTVAPPTDHALSVDGGETWHTEPVPYGDMNGGVLVMLKSEAEDGTKGAVCECELNLKIDTVPPSVEGIVANGTFCLEASFTVDDVNPISVTSNGEPMRQTDGGFTLSPGAYSIVATDDAGNSTAIQVTVNPEHTLGDIVADTEPTCTEEGVGHRTCSTCGQDFEEAVDPLGHDFGEWIVVEEAGPYDDGYSIRECSRCDETEIMTIPATGPDYPPYFPGDDDWVPPFPNGGGGTGDDGGLTDDELAVLLLTLAIVCALLAIFLLILAKRRKDDEEESR